jgi:single-stranded DNA-binding protein
MFKISDSVVKVTKQKVISDKLTVATAYSTHKVGEGFVKTFIECKFVGNALETFKQLGIKDKQKITILEGVLRNEPYTSNGKTKSKNVITIFEMGEYVKASKPNGTDDEMIEIEDGDIPF